MTEDQFRQKISGRKNDQILPLLFGRPLSSTEIVDFAEEKEAIYRELYEPFITPLPGLLNLLAALEQHHIKLAIATTAPPKNREFGLRELGLQDTFPVIMGEEHASQGKPDPEIYLKTSEQLAVEPQFCVVFEDSPSGVASGKAAGMTVVGILTTHTADELAQADIIVSDFSELTLN